MKTIAVTFIAFASAAVAFVPRQCAPGAECAPVTPIVAPTVAFGAPVTQVPVSTAVAFVPPACPPGLVCGSGTEALLGAHALPTIFEPAKRGPPFDTSGAKNVRNECSPGLDCPPPVAFPTAVPDTPKCQPGFPCAFTGAFEPSKRDSPADADAGPEHVHNSRSSECADGDINCTLGSLSNLGAPDVPDCRPGFVCNITGKRGPSFDPAGDKYVGNGQGQQFVGGQCLNAADCASGCCAGPLGICSAPDASTEAGKTGCGFVAKRSLHLPGRRLHIMDGDFE